MPAFDSGDGPRVHAGSSPATVAVNHPQVAEKVLREVRAVGPCRLPQLDSPASCMKSVALEGQQWRNVIKAQYDASGTPCLHTAGHCHAQCPVRHL